MSCYVLQGYYRRADANFALGKIKNAYADFKRAAKVAPRDPDLRKKLLECEKEVKRIRFEEALALPVSGRSIVLSSLLLPMLITPKQAFAAMLVALLGWSLYRCETPLGCNHCRSLVSKVSMN